MSDGCATQKKVNTVMMDLFAHVASATGEASEIEMIRGEMRDFYCWYVLSSHALSICNNDS